MNRFLTYTIGLCSLLLLIGQGCVSVGGKEEINTAGPAGMFVSIDQGKNWKAVSRLPQSDGVIILDKTSVYRIIEDPTDVNAMYWASREDGLFYSYDDGVSWQHAKGELSNGFVYGVSVDPEDKCNVLATNGAIMYKTTDCSRTWREVHREDNPKERVSSIVYHPEGNGVVIMGKSGGQLLRSNDNGITWRVLNRFKARLQKVVLDPFNANTIYVSTRGNGLFRSDDAGETWTQIIDQLRDYPKATEYRRFDVHPSKANTVYWTSRYGILVSNDRGETWNPVELITPPGSVDIYGFAVDPKDSNILYYTGTFQGRSTFYKSLDNGVTWTTEKMPSGQIPTSIRVHPEKDFVYIGFTIPPSN